MKKAFGWILGLLVLLFAASAAATGTVNIVVPETVPAGVDVVMHWTPEESGRCLEAYFESDGHETGLGGLSAEGDIIIPGYLIAEPGTYSGSIGSYFPDGTGNTLVLNYTITVVENAAQPAAPALTYGTVYSGVPFSVQFDQAYDEAYISMFRNGAFLGEKRWTDLTDAYMTVTEAGTLEAKVTARTGNVWSEVLQEEMTVQFWPEILLYNTEDSITLGEDWGATMLLPGDSGYVHADLLNAFGNSMISTWSTELYQTNRWVLEITGAEMVESGLTAGEYTFRVLWENNGEEVVRTFPLTVTGETPVRTVVTDGPFSVSQGETICVTGNAGSANWIEVEWLCYHPGSAWPNRGWGEAAIDANGVWTYELTAANVGYYTFRFKGMNGWLSTGNASFRTFVTDTSFLPAPTISVEEEEGYLELSFLPGVTIEGENGVIWYVSSKRNNEGSYSFEEGYSGSSDGSFSHTVWNEQYEEEHTVTVVYQYDGVYSLPASVTVSTPGDPYPINGPLPINFSIPGTWPANTDMTIDWTPAVEGQDMWMYLYHLGDNASQSIEYVNLSSAGTFKVLGCYLEEGDYVLHFVSEADTYEYTERDYLIEVVPNANLPAAPSVVISPAAPTTMSTVRVQFGETYENVYYRLLSWNEEDEIWEEYRDWWANYSTNEISIWSQLYVGSWKIETRVCQNGVWSEPTVSYFDVVEAPTLGLVDLAESLPEIQINKRFSIAIAPVEHATRYSVTLYCDSDEVMRGSAWVDAGNTENVVINLNNWPEDAQPGSGYWLRIEASGTGYWPSYAEIADLTVTMPSQVPAAPTQVQITARNGDPLTTEQTQNLYVYSLIPVKVSYSQPMQMVQVKLVQDGETVVSDTVELNPSAGTWILRDQIEAYVEGNCAVQARVMAGDFWSAWSTPVSLHVLPRPEADPITVTLEKTTMNLGESLMVTVGNIDPRTGSLSFSVGDYYMSYEDPSETMTVTLPEHAFAEGSNTIYISAWGPLVEGNEAEAVVTVSGTRPLAPEVSFSALSADFGDTLYATVEAPGASQVEIRGWGVNNYFAVHNGIAVVPIEIDYYSSRFMMYQFRARIGGVWSEWTERFQIASNTAAPTISSQNFAVIPTEIIPGQDLEITFLPVEGITCYYISMENGSSGYYRDYYEPGTVSIPASFFREGGFFYFDIGAGVNGYVDLLVNTFTLSCEPFADGVLTPLSVTAVDNELNYLEEGQISLGSLQVEEASIQYLRKHSNYSYGDVWGDEESWSAPAGETSSVVKIQFNGRTGTQTVRVSARVNGTWTDWSNPVTFTIAEREPELLHNPVPQVAAVIASGQDAHISWNAVAHAESYDVCWFRQPQGQLNHLTTTDLYADLPAEDLTPGVWTVFVVSNAQGYLNDGYSERAQFTVTENQDPSTILRLPDDLTTIESEAFAGVGAVAVYIPESVTSIAVDAFDAGITIYGVEGSYAESYAQSRNLPFVPNE